MSLHFIELFQMSPTYLWGGGQKTTDGRQKGEEGIRKWKCGLQPEGAIEAYAPEGSRNDRKMD
jgi:hypothetical protein